MKIRRLELAGFGCLRGFEADLAPGLNLFFGLNEAGKSTLQQAVCALLYGFYDADRARPDEIARHERFRPWQGGPFRGALEYELADGRGFEVRRDFGHPDVPTQLIDSSTGLDIVTRFGQSRHGNVPFARKHLGMTRTVFQSSAFISQGEIFDVARESPRQIGDAIAALADSARRDVSAAGAIARIDGVLSKLGSDRARTAELPRARHSLKEAVAELDGLTASQRELASREVELEETARRSTGVSDEAIRLELLLAQSQAAELRALLEAVRAAEAEIERARSAAQEHAEYENFPSQRRDEMIVLREHVRQARETLRNTLEALDLADQGLPAGDRLEFESLRISVAALSAEQLEELRTTAYTAASRVDLLSIVASAAHSIVRALRGLILRLLRRTPPGPAAPVFPRVSQDEALVLLERHTRFLSLRPVVENVARLQRQSEEERVRLEAIEQRLRGLFDETRLDRQGEADDLCVAFLEACDRHTRYKLALASEATSRRSRVTLLSGRSPRELEVDLGEHEDHARRLLAARPHLLGSEIDAAPTELSRRLDGLRREQRELDVRGATLGEEARLLRERHRPAAEIEEDVERWRREVARLELARAALQAARGAIEEAMTSVHRNFVPRVNAFLSEGMESVTGGRYRRAHVDPGSLRISLLVPETEMVVTDPPVSHGTRTIAYILMRLGLARHMSAIGEPVPLILDDPFVDVDHERLPRILEFLSRLSEDSQVLVFTKDEAIVRWLEREPAGQRHMLHQLPSAIFVATGV